MQQKRSPYNNSSNNKQDKHLLNEQITASEVRLITDAGEQLGVMKTSQALQLAEERGLDLVVVSENSTPPVCKLIDYGKLKYREQKKAAEARKKTAVQTVKELRIRYNTDKHDLETKIRNARKFLEEGDRVRFQMRFKGREAVYEDLGREIFNQVIGLLEDLSAVEDFSPLMGHKMLLTLVPKPAAPKLPTKA